MTDTLAAALEAAIGTNVDLTATLALGALSIATFGHVKIRIEEGFEQPTNLYLVVALPPTEGKSPAHDKMITPLRQWETDRMARHAKARAEAEAEVEILTKRAKELVDNAARTNSPEDFLAAQAAKAAVAEYQAPPTGQMFVGDTSPETGPRTSTSPRRRSSGGSPSDPFLGESCCELRLHRRPVCRHTHSLRQNDTSVVWHRTDKVDSFKVISNRYLLKHDR